MHAKYKKQYFELRKLYMILAFYYIWWADRLDFMETSIINIVPFDKLEKQYRKCLKGNNDIEIESQIKDLKKAQELFLNSKRAPEPFMRWSRKAILKEQNIEHNKRLIK